MSGDDTTTSSPWAIAVVICIIVGLLFCIGVTVITICLIKKCNRPRGMISDGMVLHSYPPNPYSVPNYPPQYPPQYPPPYTSLESECTKVPYA